MSERVGAVVLAGGRSSRFGRDKLAEPVDGRPILDRAISAARSVSGDVHVVVVLAPGDDRPLPVGVQRVTDPRAHEGPLAGLVTGLGALPDGLERVVVVGGDMPSLVPAVLDRLLAGLEPGVDATWLEGEDRPRPLPMAVRRAPALALATALSAAGERRLRALPAALEAVIVPAATWRVLDPDGLTLRDVDVPTDL